MIRTTFLAAALLAAAPAFAQTAPAAKPMTTPAPVQNTAMTPDAARLDINSATVEQLAGVKGLGKTLAEAIVKGRPYKSADDLVTSKILTGEVFALVKDFLVVRQK